MKNNTNLIEGNIGSTLLKLSLPIVLTNFIQTAYGMIDMIWVGKLGSDGVAAIGTASFFINLSMALVTLIVIGSGIKIAQSVGAGKREETNQYIKNSIIMTLILGMLYSIFIFIFNSKLIGFYKLDNNVSEMAMNYLAISNVGIIFMYFNSLISSILNSFGNSKTPFKANTIGFLINMILDPILIFGVSFIPGLGVVGAAVATLISRIIVFIIFIYTSRDIINIFKEKSNINKKKMLEVLRMGVPVASQRVIFIFISMIIAKIIVQWGSTAIAVQKVGIQIESISYMTIGGLQGAIAAFVGQNLGAQKYSRIIEGYKKAILITGSFGLFITIIFLIFPKQIFSVFISESDALNMGVTYLRILAVSQVFMCMELLTVGAFNGLGKTYVPPIISIIFTAARIPLALILSMPNIMGLDGIWVSISLSSFIKGVILVSWFSIVLKRIKSNHLLN